MFPQKIAWVVSDFEYNNMVGCSFGKKIILWVSRKTQTKTIFIGYLVKKVKYFWQFESKIRRINAVLLNNIFFWLYDYIFWTVLIKEPHNIAKISLDTELNFFLMNYTQQIKKKTEKRVKECSWTNIVILKFKFLCWMQF